MAMWNNQMVIYIIWYQPNPFHPSGAEGISDPSILIDSCLLSPFWNPAMGFGFELGRAEEWNVKAPERLRTSATLGVPTADGGN